MKPWHKTIFWENVKRTIATFTGPTVVGLHEFGAADEWVILAGCLSFAGAILSIWMTDQDNDGIIDMFQ
jgi:hypothetical protein